GVRDREHISEVVREVQDRDAAPVQPVDNLEQAGRLVLAERRGRLVHHDELGAPRERPQELDLLSIANRQRSDRQVAGYAKAGRLVELPISPPLCAAVEEAA